MLFLPLLLSFFYFLSFCSFLFPLPLFPFPFFRSYLFPFSLSFPTLFLFLTVIYYFPFLFPVLIIISFFPISFPFPLSFFLFPVISLSFLILFNFSYLFLSSSLTLLFHVSDLQTGSVETCSEWPMAHCSKVQAGTSLDWRVTSLTQSCWRKSILSPKAKSIQSLWRFPTCSPSLCTASTSTLVTTRSTVAVLRLLCSLEPNQQVSKTNKPNLCTYDCISRPAKY